MSDDLQFQYVCPGCQTKLVSDGDGGTKTVPVDKVRDGLNSRGTAETLAKIHAVKTGHEPEVMTDA